jgi:hypothetical protein
MATRYSGAPSPPDSKAVGITLAPGPGRAAALAIAGVPLALFLVVGYVTAHGSTGPANAYGSQGTGLYPADTPTATAFPDTGQAAPTDATSSGSEDVSPSTSTAAAATPSWAVGDTTTPAEPVTVTGPAGTVLSAYAAINQQDYQTAYSLGLGDPPAGESLQQYAAGYADTVSVTVTITAVQDGVVTVNLDALHTDGTHHTFAGTYTVSGGQITDASIQPTN